ncbi:MAG TPA: hypothetical protein VK119_11050 [Bacillota bacterium]|nr:hypothetical protein [Bacillota bacterium]
MRLISIHRLDGGTSHAFSQYVRPGTAAVNSLKSKAGWLGVAITTGENMYNNIQSGESTTTIVEDVAVDASLGVVSMLAAGAATAAAVGAGAPVLVGAAAGVGVSVVASYALDGIKLKGHSARAGLKKGVKAVAGWFKK